ncbi:MAG TPA: FAD-dependent thymidylate synthase [Chloroflexi bacterium]|nr:FAD-dependent thymidylate synthase [Chloroflexota bacterium]HAL26545.1 FAD-dependent thymidylate synthase [Chloroflexota bacterium]
MDTLERPATVTGSQRTEIEAQRQATHETHRATVPAMEALLYQPIPILDHGFVRVIDYMGDDAAVVQAARVSYGAGTKKIREDAGLINYLMRHRHTSPFEMCELKIHVKMPIFVARQWIRHRVANLNEVSGRYSILDNEFYMPDSDNVAAQARTNRQGRGDVLNTGEAARVLQILRDDATRSYTHYEEMLNEIDGQIVDPERQGLARELARMNLPVSLYTQLYWKIDLHNLLHFLNLRAAPHAQYEIRMYAEALIGVVKQWVPLTYAAFMDYRMGAYELSAKGLAAVRRLLRGEQVERESTGMSPGEWRELMETLER